MGGGQKRSNQLAVIDNNSIFGRSRIALKMFDTPQEAYNCEKYLQSIIVRFLFLMSDESLSTLGEYVPDWPSYINNTWIDFSMNVDEQLKSLCHFTDEECGYMKEMVLMNSKAVGE